MLKKTPKKRRQELTFEYFKWLSIGFGIASVGIAIAVILFLVTFVNK